MRDQALGSIAIKNRRSIYVESAVRHETWLVAARALLGRFAPGERVAIWAPNCPEWLLTEFGAALAGLTLVTVNPALRGREVAHVLGQSRAHGVVVAPSYRGTDLPGLLAQVRGQLPALREVISLADWDSFVRSGSPAERLPDVRPDDDAQIEYTSGTTGLPKGAVLRHRGITNNAGSARRSCRPAREMCGSTRFRCSTPPGACSSRWDRYRACSPRYCRLVSTPGWCCT